MLILRTNLNLILCGPGSKRELLGRFLKTFDRGFILEVDGLVGSITEVLQCIAQGFLGLATTRKSEWECIKEIEAFLENEYVTLAPFTYE